MRIALVTTSRFTLLDLARELAALGHDVRFYSLVPPARTKKFGLPAQCNRWLGSWCAPFYGAAKLARGTRLEGAANRALDAAVDFAAARSLEPCDVLIGMSGICVRVLEVAKRKYGATVFLERSSRHIESQRDILAELAQRQGRPAPRFDTSRELAGYAIADVVSVPSRHVAESFRERQFPEQRLFVNPFGVSLETFPPTRAPDHDTPSILTVGAWSLRKGSDVLVEAWRGLSGVKLLHVGPVGDAPLPSDAGFEHVDAVPQSTLPAYYAQSDVFALASREEGLAVVQAQALASGVPIVCTSRTGGEDLQRWSAAAAIEVVPPDDVDALRAALERAIERRPPRGTDRDLLGSEREQLSWRAYAQRYEHRVREVLVARGET